MTNLSRKSPPRRNRQNNGLRSEILFTLAFLLGASLLLGGLLFLRYTEQNLVQQRIQSTTLGMQLIADNLGEYDLSNNLPMSKLYPLQDQLNANAWWVFDRNLTLQFSYARIKNPAVPRTFPQQVLLTRETQVNLDWSGPLSLFNSAKQELQLAVPIGIGEHLQGILVAYFSLNDISRKLTSAQHWLLFYVLAYGTVMVITGLYLLNRNIVRPTHNLLEATRKVASGDLDLHLKQSGPREIYALAESFNHMAAALRKSHEEAEIHIRSLSETNQLLKQAQAELVRSEKLATVGYLAAGMAHEIGNPLGALTGFLELLKKDIDEPSQVELLEQATGATERIDRLVRELLDYSTPGNSLVEIVDPWAVVKNAVQLLKLQGVFKNCDVNIDSNLELPAINIDSHKLEQVIVNLLLNSKDACSDGGHIDIAGTATNNRVIICVKDTGCGISPGRIGAIFEPFYTTKAPGKGSGLGLAICQRIVSEAHGEISCNSTLGQGCSFSLVFPVAREPAA